MLPVMFPSTVQDAFVKAYRQMSGFRGQSSERTWLMSIAINTCRDYLRSVAAAAGLDGFVVAADTDFRAERLRQLDLIADAIEEHLAGPALAAATGVPELG